MEGKSIMLIKKIKANEIYLTQNELAERWKCALSTIKSMRDKGELPFFTPPGSVRILYPIDQIVLIEIKNTENTKREDLLKVLPAEIKRKPPVVSSKENINWRV
jgi:hypothetical protein